MRRYPRSGLGKEAAATSKTPSGLVTTSSSSLPPHCNTINISLLRFARALFASIRPFVHHLLCIANPRGSKLHQAGASPRQNYIPDAHTSSPDRIFAVSLQRNSHAHDHYICRSTNIIMSDSINWGTPLSDLGHVGEGEAEPGNSPAQLTYDPVSGHGKYQLRCSSTDHSSTTMRCMTLARRCAQRSCTNLHLTATLGPWLPLQTTPTC